MTIAAHITSTDPLGLATAGVINLKSITPSTPRNYLEAVNPGGRSIANAIKVLRPLIQYDIVYELLDTASLVLPFGVAVNTNFLLTSASCNSAPEKYPEVTVSCIRPSAANMIKAYSGGVAVVLTCVGGMGIVNKFGATSTAAFISSQASVSMKNLDAVDEVSGDFLVGGIYRYGFKLECQMEAYGEITIPVAAHATPNKPATPKETAEGWQIYPASFWKYLDPI